jgi:Ras-related protein Rab-28
MIGDGTVGKTSIAVRFSEDKFSQIYKQTVGVDFFIKRLQISCKSMDGWMDE